MSMRINKKRLSLALLVGIILVIAGSLAIKDILEKREQKLDYAKVELSPAQEYKVAGGYISYATEEALVQYQLNSQRISETKINSPIDGFDVSSSMTAVYAGSAFHIRNYPGLQLTGTIRSVACSTHYCAVLRTSQSSGTDSLAIFNASGEPVGDPIDFTDAKVLSFGFNNSEGREILWVICLDVDGSQPVTAIRLYDYANGGAMSYYPNFYDQSVEKLVITEESVFLVGTQDIIRYAQGGSKEQYRVHIYGKELLDYKQDGDHVYFLLKPRAEEENRTLFVMALTEGDTANQTSMTLSTGEPWLSAYLENRGVRLITPTRFISYNYSGKKLLDETLLYPAVDAVHVDAGQFLLVSQDACYMCTER